MKLLLTALICSFSVQFGLSQKWGKITESAYTTEAMDVETDAAGNSYVTGYITGETAFGNNNSFPSAPGNGDIYVAKYNPSGTLVWVKRFGGNYSDRAYDLCLDNSGNIFITGQFFGSVNFDGNIISSSGNSKDIFLAKLNNSGIASWAISEGGSDVENAYGITCDGLGNVILTGQFKGTSTLNGQTFTSMIDPLTGLPSFDMFISKYDASGNALWIQTGSAKYEDRGLAVACDAMNNVYMTGQFTDTLLFAGNTYNNNAYNVGLIAKFSPTGSLTWINTIRASFLLPYDLEIRYDKIHIAGDARGTIIYQNNGTPQYTPTSFENTAFILKTNLNGQQNWVETVGSDDVISARAISVDIDSNIFVTGHFKCALTELHENNTALYNSVGFKDVFLWKVNHEGNFEYLKTGGSTLDDNGNGVALKSNDDAVICGGSTERFNVPISTSLTYEIDITNYFNFDYYDYFYDNQNNYNPYYNQSYYYGQFYYGEFIHLNGDASMNAFITNAISTETPEYNFFFGNPNDSLDLVIFGPADTVNFCESDTLYANPKTYIYTGPKYNFLWSNGGIIDTTIINSTDIYWLNIERLDECSSGTDSIYEIYNPNPALPLLTDNLGLAIESPGALYYSYNFCYPDSVTWWFTNLDTNNTIQISSEGIVFNDTLPHTYFNDAFITIQSDYCQSFGLVKFEFDYVMPYNYNPFLTLLEEMDYNDSTTVCFGDTVLIENHDYNNNPTGVYGLMPEDPLVWQNWSATLNGVSVPIGGPPYLGLFFPQQTGNYIITYSNSIGYNNLCGLDTSNFIVIDTFFIEVIPTPIPPLAPILGDNFLCPNGSVYLTVASPVPGYNWYGPGVFWVSSNLDSAQVTVAGTYTYGGTYIDPINGCSDTLFNYFTLIEKEPPIISSDPVDGIICPNDSIYMSISDNYISYEWFGPNGSGLSYTFEHWDDDQGFYYVTALDDEGCYLTSPPFELKEYSTPYLSLEPSNFLCEDDEATITAVIVGDGVFQWLNPLNYPNDELTVTQAGWYSVSMTQCGITILDSVQIIDATFSISLNYSDSILCFDQDVLVSTTPGLSDYQWNNPEVFGSTILVQDPGEYYVTAINNYGCEATSDTAVFTSIIASEPPTIEDTFTCVPGVISILNDLATNWYTMDSVFISNGISFDPSIQSDTSFLVSYAASECPVVYAEFLIDFVQDMPIFEISGDSIVCSGNTLELSVNSTDENVAWFLNGISIGTNSDITISSNQILSVDSVFVVISSPCYADTLTYFFQTFDIQELTLNLDSIVLCADEEIVLTSMETYGSISWSGSFGTESSDSLVLAPGFPAGFVYAQAIDSNGCETGIDTVEIAYISDVIPPIFDPIIICAPGTAELVNDLAINWYSNDSIYLDNSTTYSVNITSDTSFLASFAPAGCSVQYSQIDVIIAQNIPLFQIFGDTLLCEDEALELSTDAINDSLNWILNGISVGSEINLNLDYSSLSNGDVISLIISNECYSDTLYQSLSLPPQNPISLAFDTLILCPGNNITITINEVYPLINWTDGTNTYPRPSLDLNTTSFSSGYIYVSGIDSNGCETVTDQFYLEIPELPVDIFVNFGLNCVGDSIQFQAITSADSILWQTPIGLSTSDTLNVLVSESTAGSYVLQAWDENGCMFSAQTEFTANSLPNLDLPADTIVCSSIDLPTILSNNNLTFNWLNSSAIDSISNGISSWYYYSLNGTNGCEIQDSILLTLVNCEDELPNVFTPNGDGINDYLIIDEAIILPNNYLIIYNRWGENVFEEKGYRNTFNGQNLSDGVYFYKFHKDTVDDPLNTLSGFFHIIR